MVDASGSDAEVIEPLVRIVDDTPITVITRLTGGGNNRVFRVQTDSRILVAKLYHHDPDDRRDRAGTEYGFSRYLWDAGVRTIPEPLASDLEHHAVLYENIDGSTPSAGDVTPAQRERALTFFAEIDAHRVTAVAKRLAPASEACFSTADHLAMVEHRLDRLNAIAPDPTNAIVSDRPIDCDAATFVREELQPEGRRLLRSAASALRRITNPDSPLPQAQRCLSPSDFGFHNTLMTDDGGLVFHDFEYAGWDDPAKMVCDFFTQPRVPVPMSYWDTFVAGICETIGLDESHGDRMRALLPAHRVKWACIALNEFLPTEARRRAFSRGEHDIEERKTQQLEIARSMLARAKV